MSECVYPQYLRMNWQGLNSEEEAEKSANIRRKDPSTGPSPYTPHKRFMVTGTSPNAELHLRHLQTFSARLEPCAPVIKTTGIATTLSKNCTVWTMTMSLYATGVSTTMPKNCTCRQSSRTQHEMQNQQNQEQHATAVVDDVI